MDILIKSFNRPYYLNRCIESIYANVLDDNFLIKILDDGTPQKYLDKIQSKFPKVEILKSAFYDEKAIAIEKDLVLENHKIPIDLWLNAAKNATEYFLLLEDDIWFTEKINLKETQGILIEENVFFLKLFWLKNSKLIHGRTNKTKECVTIFEPIVFTQSPFLYRFIFGTKRFGIREIMCFMHLYTDERLLNYYSIYGVAGAIFNKKYFLSLWENHQNTVDENLQLKNAVKYWHQNPNIKFARTNVELVTTGFLSSATNKKSKPSDFDSFQFNKIINEAWYCDTFNVMDQFPKDLNSLAIEAILSKENNPAATPEDWKQWVFDFKKQFQDLGCTI